LTPRAFSTPPRTQTYTHAPIHPPIHPPPRRSEGLDFAPMERDEVLAAVHDVVSHALYEETHLFYGRHLDQVGAGRGRGRGCCGVM